METWIKLYRKLLASPVFDNPTVLKVWLWALLKATHQVRQAVIGYQTITLNPGEFIYGRITAAEELKMNESTVRNCLAMLAKLGNLDIKPTNKFSIVKINNWTAYQELGQQNKNKIKTKDQQKTTDNNVKNVKNVNKSTNVDKGVAQGYGRPDINECTEYFKTQLGGSLDGTRERNRIFCKHLLDRMAKDYPALPPVDQVKTLIDAGRLDPFHRKNMTGFEYLYKNAQKIIEATKSLNSKIVSI